MLAVGDMVLANHEEMRKMQNSAQTLNKFREQMADCKRWYLRGYHYLEKHQRRVCGM